ncbi:MAG: hypothetical protein UZ05_CHB002002497 [Chlorobi bacterium OLB5]|nr:MAG: hypothetical protein UZ05_CHB002002497 [Chlorobi bacterium OLB5]
MFMLTLQQISLLFIKSYIVDNVGLYSVGIFQSVLSISNNYLALFFSVIATYSLPKLSTLDNNKDKIIEINHILKLVILIYTPLIVLLYIFRVYFILILYSEDFLPNNQLLFYQLSGDYFRALSWIFGLWLLPNLKIKQWLIFDLFNSVCITIVSVILFRIYNSIEVFSLAYLITHFIQVIIQFFYIRFSLGFNFLFNNLNVLSISLTYLIVIFIISRMDVVLGYLIVLPSTLLWLVFVVRKTELESIKLLFVSYIRRN